ncbi:hypothetical protein [Cellvibrio mixtus]|uniref:hypothetical protein n=1 Tax=Cellvibrio mixtus TaxID=39650 RepID=UPI0005873366|nr:hypothetical protein [Cellvibrio mixtus]
MSRVVLAQQWQQIKQQWHTNRRLQAASFIALGLFVLWIHARLDDWRLAKKEDAKVALNMYLDTQAVAREHEWIERAKTSDVALQQMRTKLWHASSEGEAEAQLRDWIQKIAKESGLGITRITLEVSPPPRGFTWYAVRADLQGTYVAGAWQRMLNAMATNTPPVLVDYEQLNLVTSTNLFYRINVTAWFVIKEPSVGQ